MTWSHRGLLLEAPPALPWAASHAALPHFEPLPDGRARLYFSTRDAQGRSHIARGLVDLEHAHVELEVDPVLAPGPLGAYDDSGVTASSLVVHEGRAYLYFTGWSLGKTVPFYLFAGCATSDDGATFERISAAPILPRAPVDPFMTLSPWVLHDEGRFRMWYVSCTEWCVVDGEPQHRYHIKYADSDDGIEWRRDGIVCIDYRDDEEYAIARPCVVRDGGTYKMWFSARGERYRLGYAESSDGIAWTRFDEVPGFQPSGDWDSEMQEYPVVFDHGGRRWLAYNGNDYGRSGIGYAVETR